MSSAWTYNDIPEGTDVAPASWPQEKRERFQSNAWQRIVQGYDDPDEFVEAVFDDEGITTQEATSLYAALLAIRREQQAGFGDDVRSNIAVAFEALNEAGVVARADFTCCGSCASAEIHDEADDSRRWKGWVWYHQQDTESLAESENGEVYLGYGAYPAEDFDQDAYDKLKKKEKKRVYEHDVQTLMNETVFPILREHGMDVTWDGDLDYRILVTGARLYERV